MGALCFGWLLDGRGLLRALAHVAPGPLPAGSPRRRVREGGSSNGLLDARALSSTAPARLVWYVALGPGNYRRGKRKRHTLALGPTLMVCGPRPAYV